MRFNFSIWFRFSISCEKTFTPQLYRLRAAVVPATRQPCVSTFPRVAGGGWRLTGNGWRVAGDG